MERIEDLNKRDCEVIMNLFDSISKSGRIELADRLHDFLIENTMLIRNEIS